MKKLKKIPDIYIIFLVYALIGWLYEVIWLMFVVPPYHFVNRGVLFGPFLPIYGIGMLMLLVILNKFMKEKHTLKNPIYLIISVLTIVTFIYTTIVEYTTPKIYNPIDYLTNYGIGLLLVNLITLIITYILVKNNKKLQKIDVTIILVFIAIWLITTSLEYVVHYLNEAFRNELLWDYSKDFLNINRRVNCEVANITKTVNAATKQIEDITFIKDHYGFNKLQESLRQMAEVRLEHPDATLLELGTYLDPPVGKSGVNHRLRKLSELADKIRS